MLALRVKSSRQVVKGTGTSVGPGVGDAFLPQDFTVTGLHMHFPDSQPPSHTKTPSWLAPGMASGDSLPVASMMSRKLSEA